MKAPSRIVVTSWLIILSLGMFEVFSYSSSYEALMSMFGIRAWAFALAFGLCVVDFAGLAKLLMPDMRDLPEFSLYFLMGAWVVSALGDTSLTWFVVSRHTSTLTSHALVQSGILSIKFFTTWIPLIVAMFTWGIQLLLVTRLGIVIDSWIAKEGKSNGK